MKRFFIILFITTVTSSVALAQLDFNDFLKTLPQSPQSTNFAVKQNTVVKGSPYIYEEWVNGQIMASARKTKSVSMKLNFAEDFLVVNNGGNPVYLGFNQIDGIEIYTPQRKIFKTGFSYSKKERIDKNTLMEVIYDGGTKILRKHVVTLSKSVATYGTANRQDVYKKSDELLALQDGKYKEIKLKKKDILRLFEKEKRDKIEDFAKKKNLSFKNETHVSSIMQYGESL